MKFKGKTFEKRLSVEDYKEIIKDTLIFLYAELGILNGDQLDIAVKSTAFDYCTGIELSKEYAYKCHNRFSKDKKVTILNCSSIEFLSSPLINDVPYFFLLDSHYCKTTKGDPNLEKTEFPLWEELRIIKDRNFPDIIAVDDIHTFGKNRKHAPYWKDVTRESILKFLGDKVVRSKDYKDTFVIWLK